MALATGRLSYHSPVWFWYHAPPEARLRQFGNQWLYTTAGRVLFNSILPRAVLAELGFHNDLMRKGALSAVVFEAYRRAGLSETVQFLDRLKDFGFAHATRGGVSIGVQDLEIPGEKATILEAQARVERFQRPTRPARSPSASGTTR
jgi:DNA-directed RNA polymerase subunit beta'